jgi:hypothetical protein
MSKYLIALSAAALAACSAGMQPNPNETSLNEGAVSQALEEPLVASPAAEAPAEPGPIVEERLVEERSAEERLAGAKRTTSPSCDILVQPTSHGVRLKAVARLGEAVSGRYSMVVTKRGSAGSSDITQGGPFKSSGEKNVSLSSAELSVEEASNYRAVLTLHVGDRQACRREVRS